MRAHQHTAGARKGGRTGRARRSACPAGGGLTTKIHLACDGMGRPLAFTLTAGNVNDCTQFEQVIRCPREVTAPRPASGGVSARRPCWRGSRGWRCRRGCSAVRYGATGAGRW
ncbi:transposase [Streptomyces sp. IBSBF 2507]|uniref:transposase n=1 Tax=Streptomyces sp. IBSBF 2507 TaxID=2903530 RepID=UPI00351E9516